MYSEEEIMISKLAFILSVLGLFLWLVPFVGFSVSFSGVLLSIRRLKVRSTTITQASLIMSITGLIISVINIFLVYFI
ncbi:MAG: hypothetical protein ACOCRK_03970 [bacterium]